MTRRGENIWLFIENKKGKTNKGKLTLSQVTTWNFLAAKPWDFPSKFTFSFPVNSWIFLQNHFFHFTHVFLRPKWATHLLPCRRSQSPPLRGMGLLAATWETAWVPGMALPFRRWEAAAACGWVVGFVGGFWFKKAGRSGRVRFRFIDWFSFFLGGRLSVFLGRILGVGYGFASFGDMFRGWGYLVLFGVLKFGLVAGKKEGGLRSVRECLYCVCFGVVVLEGVNIDFERNHKKQDRAGLLVQTCYIIIHVWRQLIWPIIPEQKGKFQNVWKPPGIAGSGSSPLL